VRCPRPSEAIRASTLPFRWRRHFAGGAAQALVELQDRQPLNAQTGSVHAAAWALPGKEVFSSCVKTSAATMRSDKVIGALTRAGVDCGTRTAHYPLQPSQLRKWWQKGRRWALPAARFPRRAAATAAGLARGEPSLRWLGFARAHRHVVYANPTTTAGMIVYAH